MENPDISQEAADIKVMFSIQVFLLESLLCNLNQRIFFFIYFYFNNFIFLDNKRMIHALLTGLYKNMSTIFRDWKTTFFPQQICLSTHSECLLLWPFFRKLLVCVKCFLKLVQAGLGLILLNQLGGSSAVAYYASYLFTEAGKTRNYFYITSGTIFFE